MIIQKEQVDLLNIVLYNIIDGYQMGYDENLKQPENQTPEDAAIQWMQDNPKLWTAYCMDQIISKQGISDKAWGEFNKQSQINHDKNQQMRSKAKEIVAKVSFEDIGPNDESKYMKSLITGFKQFCEEIK
jgi:hypothetical protein